MYVIEQNNHQRLREIVQEVAQEVAKPLAYRLHRRGCIYVDFM